MTLKWNGDAAKQDISAKIGEGLARCAVHFQTQHKLRLNKSNPIPYLNSSKVGEYPAARTGFGRDATSYDPTSPADMASQGSVRMGYLLNGWYMGLLEIYRGRLGLKKTLEDLRQQFTSILEAVGAKK